MPWRHEARLLRGPGRRQDARRGGDQEGVPQAGHEVPPRPQPRRRRGRGQVQGGAEALRGPARPEKRERYDRYGHAGLDGMTEPRLRPADVVRRPRSATCSAFFGGGRRPAAARPAARAATCGWSSRSTWSRRPAGSRRRSRSARHEVCVECGGSGEARAPSACDLPRCKGRGVVVQRQGFFELQQTCPACQGRGAVIADPCRRAAATGGSRSSGRSSVDRPAGRRHGTAAARRRRGRRGRRRGAARATWTGRPGPRAPAVPARRRDLFIEVFPITFSQAALGATIEVPTLDRQDAS